MQTYFNNHKKYIVLILLFYSNYVFTSNFLKLSDTKKTYLKRCIKLSCYSLIHKTLNNLTDFEEFKLYNFYDNFLEKKLNDEFKRYLQVQTLRLGIQFFFLFHGIYKISQIKRTPFNLLYSLIAIHSFYKYFNSLKNELSALLDIFRFSNEQSKKNLKDFNDLKSKHDVLNKLIKEKLKPTACQICQYDISIYACSECLQLFHTTCLQQWGNKNPTCTNCRSQISFDRLNELNRIVINEKIEKEKMEREVKLQSDQKQNIQTVNNERPEKKKNKKNCVIQ